MEIENWKGGVRQLLNQTLNQMIFQMPMLANNKQMMVIKVCVGLVGLAIPPDCLQVFTLHDNP